MARMRVPVAKRAATRRARPVAAAGTKQARQRAVTATSTEPVQLHLPTGDSIPIPPEADPKQLQRDAMTWAYVVRSRRRWVGSEVAQRSPITRLVAGDKLKAIADAGLVEIEIPYTDEAAGWEYRILPWEHLLSAATKPYRGDRPLTVIRRLRTGKHAATQPDPLASVLIVESAPGGLDRFYDVKGEGNLVLDSLGLRPDDAGGTARILHNPTEAELRAEIGQRGPTLVHLAGVDRHQSIELLQQERHSSADEEEALDGYALRGTDATPFFTSALQLANVLNAGPTKPELVLCNFYNSAARIAALAVASGARYAIGYQDVIEDALAAAFCTTFYRALRSGESVLDSFKKGLLTLRDRPKRLKGAGIVLWSAESVVGATKATRHTRSKTAALKAADVAPADRIRVDVKPLSAINYSLLHNRRSLFETLNIWRRDVSGAIGNIDVNVTLHVGQDTFPFQTRLTMQETDNYLTIADDVVVPLTSSTIRTQGESIQSSLFLQVSCDDEVVHARTTRVQLSPVDEWTDSDKNRWWLPSFVLPRDPMVAKIIDRSQRYLMALADDPSAGFDGYQSIDPRPSATFMERYTTVDMQVRAIWSALLYDFRLHYVNPPPAYSGSDSEPVQRLRTPTDVVRGGRGTCIDLALLLAACLEYVDIYPVLFLLKGHAFPGYWRGDDLHREYKKLANLPDPERVTPNALRASERATEGFEDAYALKNFIEARSLIAEGKVVPLETVWLTTHGSFAEAIDEGRKNLRQEPEFDMMIDVTLARREHVTPLPILWRRE